MHDRSQGTRMLRKGLDELGIVLSDEQERQFSLYLREIALFNTAYRLIAAEGEDLVTKHLLDSLAALPVFVSLAECMPQPVTMCDVGSGAGLPGIPLAVMMPDVHVHLAERSGRRAGFLRNAVAVCNLGARVEVIERDLSAIEGRYGIVTFRAFHPLAGVMGDIGTILADGGAVCAYKGRLKPALEELKALDDLTVQGKGGSSTGWNHWIEPLHVPYLDAPRHLCILAKAAVCDRKEGSA